MIISNTSPLIYLGKIKKLQILKKLFNEVTIPRQVYDEIIKGKEEKFLDALVIENAVKDSWIKVKDAEINEGAEKFLDEIDVGEVAVISLAKKLKPSLILIDDASARTIAESFGFNVKGTLYILLKAYKRKLINKIEVKDSLNRIVFAGFRISQEIYIKFLEELDKD